MARASRFAALAIWTSLAAVAGCQQLDPNLAGGRLNQGTGGRTATVPDAGTETVLLPSMCNDLRTRAFQILNTNCAFCHQKPQSPVYPNSLDFILDLPALTSKVSPSSSTTLQQKYIVKGMPTQSYVLQRMANKTMPPAFRTQQPSVDDSQVLSQWVASCIDDADSPAGWGDSPGTGGGAGGAGGGAPSAELTPCGPANVCADGGCCVSFRCRPNGTTCGSLPNPIPGEPDISGLPGMCTTGSCMNQGGMSCGKVNEPCCDSNTCTASQSSCLITDMTKCSACGGTDQPCCNRNNCLAGRFCVGGGVGRVGTCMICGGLNQPCCGAGVAAAQTCNDMLTCVDMGTQNLCVAGGATGQGGDSGAMTSGSGGAAGSAGGGGTAGRGGATGTAGRGGRAGTAGVGGGGGR